MHDTQLPSLQLQTSAAQIRLRFGVKMMSIFFLSLFFSAALVVVTKGTKFDLANEINVSEPVKW